PAGRGDCIGRLALSAEADAAGVAGGRGATGRLSPCVVGDGRSQLVQLSSPEGVGTAMVDAQHSRGSNAGHERPWRADDLADLFGERHSFLVVVRTVLVVNPDALCAGLGEVPRRIELKRARPARIVHPHLSRVTRYHIVHYLTARADRH